MYWSNQYGAYQGMRYEPYTLASRPARVSLSGRHLTNVSRNQPLYTTSVTQPLCTARSGGQALSPSLPMPILLAALDRATLEARALRYLLTTTAQRQAVIPSQSVVVPVRQSVVIPSTSSPLSSLPANPSLLSAADGQVISPASLTAIFSGPEVRPPLVAVTTGSAPLLTPVSI